MNTVTALVLGTLFTLGVLFQVMGCAIWHNWWPALSGILYVLLPMPYVFFNTSSSSSSIYGDVSLGWVDAGKFLVGFTAVGVFMIPSILYHAQQITGGALAIELVSALFLSIAALVFDYSSTEEGRF